MGELESSFPFAGVDDDGLSDGELALKYEAVRLGPSWSRRGDGSFRVPRLTLGWAVAQWAAKWLLPLADGQDAFTFTNEQFRLILWWYAVDEGGAFAYRSMVLQRIKGWGKDPFTAVLCLVEAFGPAKFGGWDERGLPRAVARKNAWVQVFALSKEQTTNTASMFPILMSDEFKKAFGIDAGVEIIRGLNGRVRIEVKTASWRSAEGGRPDFLILNEALDVDTLVPTPSGFVRMGDLVEGDVVFGPDGGPVRVTSAKPVQVGRDCFRVTLTGKGHSLQESVVASDGHLWLSKVCGLTGASVDGRPRVRTTAEMFEDGRVFQIPRAEPLVFPGVSLPVDPYVLGYWLGDGSTGDCNVTVGGGDVDWVAGEFSRRGFPVHELGSSGRAPRLGFSGRAGFGVGMGPENARAFRLLPCFWDKHVPGEYLVASVEQRLDLLRGLMDSDGHAGKLGHAVFVGSERLSQDVYDLAVGLGFLPSRRWVADSRSRTGGYYRVSFLVEGLVPFLMPRKADVCVVRERRAWVSVRVDPVGSRPVRCISVGNESHLFVAAGGVVTHNTQHWLSSNSGAQLSRTARRNASKVKGRYVCITNMPVPGEGSVAEGDRENQLGVLEGRFEDRKVLFDSIEAPDHAPLTKRVFDVVYRQCRGDSVWCDPGDAWLEVLDTNNPEGESRRMFWNQYWLQEGSLYSPDEWASIGSSSSLSVGDRVCLGFDGGKTDDSTALVAVRVSDGLIVPLLLEEKPAGVDKWHVDVDRVNSAVHRAFRDYDVVGFWADVQFWETQIQQWSEDYGSRLLVQGAGGPIAWDMRQSRRVVGALHEAFMRAVLDGAVRHGVDPYGLGLERSFRRHVMNTVRVDSSGGVTFGKRGGRESALKVDMYAAAMLAFGAYQEVRLQSALRPPKAAGVMRVQRR